MCEGIHQVTKENSEIQSRTIAQMVSAKIENEFIKPITVSQTISSDIDIRTYIEGKTREEAESVKDDMTNRLVSIGNEFGYKMVFVVSDKTRAYYTYNGISRYLDVENDSHDIWYKWILDSGKRYTVMLILMKIITGVFRCLLITVLLTRMETFWEHVVSELI